MDGVGLMDRATFYGGSTAHITLSGAYTASSPYIMSDLGAWNRYRIWQFAPTAASTFILLPDARLCDLGGPIFWMRNTHASNQVHVGAWGPDPYPVKFVSIRGTGTPGQNRMAFFLRDNSTGAGKWLAVSAEPGALTLRGTS